MDTLFQGLPKQNEAALENMDDCLNRKSLHRICPDKILKVILLNLVCLSANLVGCLRQTLPNKHDKRQYLCIITLLLL